MDNLLRPTRLASLLTAAFALGLLLASPAEARQKTFTARYVPNAGDRT